MVSVNQPTKPSVVKKLPTDKKNTVLLVTFSILVILAGVATGWLVSGQVSGGSKSSVGEAAPGAKVSSNEAGKADESIFSDSAEGDLETGGIKGEGTHHLVRGEDESQYVYLTSTVIDLESFSGKKVKVWGETLSAENAGWMMDVGKVKVIE